MTKSTLATIGALALFGMQACVTPVSGAPWDLARGSRAQPLSRNETQVRAQYVATEESSSTGSHFVDLQYGVLDNLTLGVSEGDSLRRLSESSQIAGEEAASIGANYGILGGSGKFGLSTQLQVLFKDHSDVEFRPSFAAYGDSWIGRAGVNLQSGIDAQFVAEGAYWTSIGDFFIGMIELDAAFGDLDEAYVTPTAVTQLRELVQLQLSFPIGLTHESSDWQALLGLAFRF